MKKLTRSLVAVTFAASALLPATATPSYAKSVQYCHQYATRMANNKTNHGADILVGTLVGVGTGAVLGGIVGGHRSVGTGAIIGGVGGAAVSGVATNDKWHRVYNKYYAQCRAS